MFFHWNWFSLSSLFSFIGIGFQTHPYFLSLELVFRLIPIFFHRNWFSDSLPYFLSLEFVFRLSSLFSFIGIGFHSHPNFPSLELVFTLSSLFSFIGIGFQTLIPIFFHRNWFSDSHPYFLSLGLVSDSHS